VAKYRITIKKSAAEVVKRIQLLAEDPRPAGSQKLSAREQYRLRQGDYRIVYSVDDKDWLVDIVKIGHRRDIYR